MSNDHVMVQPVPTFLEGRDLVHPESDPYPVSRSRMLELRANGLVMHVESEPAPASPVSLDHPALAAPTRRGRPPKPR